MILQQVARIRGLDDFKWIAALLVVANHTSPLESINGTADFLLTRVLARLAVPFFFMVTGYFVLYGAYREDDFAKVRRFLRKLCLLYLGTTVLYLPVHIYQFLKEDAFYLNKAPETLFLQALKAFFFDGTHYHLWYLPAVGMGLLLTWAGLRIFGRKGAFLCAGALYLIGLLGDSYYGLTEKIPLLRNCYESMFQVFSYTRNGLLFAPLFLLLGYEAAVGTHFGKAAVRFFFFGTLFLMCGEGMILHMLRWQRHDSMYLILPFCLQGLFALLLLKEKGILGKEFFNREQWVNFYAKGPMLLYCLHPAVILGVRGFVKVTGIDFLLTISPVYYLAVLAGSLCLVYICLRIWGAYQSGNMRGR